MGHYPRRVTDVAPADRFGVISRLDYYEPEELVLIVTRTAGILEVEITREGALEIACRSRGTPRVANRLLKRVRDYAQVRADNIITREVADEALAFLEVDPLGLDQSDRRLLLAIIQKFAGGPVGLDTLAAATSEETDTLEDVYEPTCSSWACWPEHPAAVWPHPWLTSTWFGATWCKQHKQGTLWWEGDRCLVHQIPVMLAGFTKTGCLEANFEVFLGAVGKWEY